MSRFYCPNLKGELLNEEESHHAHTVMRLEVGEEIEVFDGKGLCAQSKIISSKKKEVRFKILSEFQQPLIPTKIVLAQVLSKRKSMEWVLQKATELGVNQIQPLISEHAVVRENVCEKWQGAVIEACKQCGQNLLPEVKPAIKLENYLTSLEGKNVLKIAGLIHQNAEDLKIFLDEAKLLEFSEVILLVGPEGDFSDREKELILEHKFLPASLGETILRVETASIYLISVIKYLLKI
jgi:16S rRNA (uracil1498-N3)-methyltransferase